MRCDRCRLNLNSISVSDVLLGTRAPAEIIMWQA
jgi:hypothetical protein